MDALAAIIAGLGEFTATAKLVIDFTQASLKVAVIAVLLISGSILGQPIPSMNAPLDDERRKAFIADQS